jgi:ATP-binding cassette subfamily C protein/ATP-binding cassette subfamily C protein LapB
MKNFENNQQNDEAIHKSLAAKSLIPLLDALNWKGDNDKLMQSMVNQEENMDIDDLLDTLSNLNLKHHRTKHILGKQIDKRSLPIFLVCKDNYFIIINIGEEQALVYDVTLGVYTKQNKDQLKGDAYTFKYVGDMSDSLLNQQKEWFSKLIMRFSRPLKTLVGLTFIMTLLDLLIPFFVTMLYSQIGQTGGDKRLVLLLIGVLLYFTATISLSYYRSSITNYISVRMGNIISQQIFRQLLYLTPGYTETATISSQINRIKDFENLKRFTNSGIFVNTLELCFSGIYIIAIFVMGGWVGVIPIITLAIVLLLGVVMRPFHKNRMEKTSEAKAESQLNSLEILKSADEIKISGMKEHWIHRNNTLRAKSIYSDYIQSGYIATSNNLIYFITNASVVVLIYGCILKVFEGSMSIGALMGVILIYWKVLSSIRSASSLLVQLNGLTKSVNQINRFMKLPLDTNLRANMVATKAVQGKVWFQDVSIRYKQTSKAALININFLVNPGEILGITGHDGAGKTTILKLILGMYIPQGGRIVIDSNNIKQLEPLTLRQSISYAPERDMLFSGTIRSNFRSVCPSITDQRISEIAELTGLSSYMERFGYTLDTEITPDLMDDFSPSFKKIFCITRMLARNVKLYLVDEPENYLDKEELEKIINVLTDLSKMNKATVIISSKHDQVLKCCQKVVTLNQGRVSQI